MIHFEVDGVQHGDAILMLHGWGSNLHIFDSMASELSKKYQIYRLDLPGFGESDPPESVWGVNEYTLCVEKFVQDHHISNPIVIGHSFGGRIALLFASRNEVKKLVLFNSAGVKPHRSCRYYFKVYSFKFYRKTLPLLMGKRRANERIDRYRKQTGSSDYNNAVGIMRQVLVKVVNEDLKHVMPKIEAPTLLIWGEHDTATPVRDAHIMKQRIKDSGLVVLKNAGHFGFLEKPYEVNLILNNFLC